MPLIAQSRHDAAAIYLPLDQDESGARKRSRGRKYLTLLLLLTGMMSFVVFVGAYIAFSKVSQHVRSRKSVSTELADTKPLLLISIDGFRYDFLYRGLTPNIAHLALRGIHGPLRPQFPSYTFPNHYSLVTGLYPESHGIVANAFYDPELDDFFSYTDQRNLREAKWWAAAEPIWNTIQAYGMKSATMFWPGSESEIGGRRPNYYRNYDERVTHSQRINQILKWISLPESQRPKFLSLYFSAVDDAGHGFGPDSAQLNAALKDVDYAVDLLITGLKNRALFDKINIIIVSDHGMVEVKRHIYLDDLIEDLDERVEWVDYGPVASIQPIPGDEEGIYTKLKYYQSRGMQFSVYRRDEMPARFHYRNNARIAPIVVVAEPGWIIGFRDSNWVPKGTHGYDPQVKEMQALFVGSGPDFPAGKEPIAGVSNLDVYPLMMHLLNVPPKPNNGTLKLVEMTH